jgi:hypothetical protein
MMAGGDSTDAHQARTVEQQVERLQRIRRYHYRTIQKCLDESTAILQTPTGEETTDEIGKMEDLEQWLELKRMDLSMTDDSIERLIDKDDLDGHLSQVDHNVSAIQSMTRRIKEFLSSTEEGAQQGFHRHSNTVNQGAHLSNANLRLPRIELTLFTDKKTMDTSIPDALPHLLDASTTEAPPDRICTKQTNSQIGLLRTTCSLPNEGLKVLIDKKTMDTSIPDALPDLLDTSTTDAPPDRICTKQTTTRQPRAYEHNVVLQHRHRQEDYGSRGTANCLGHLTKP